MSTNIVIDLSHTQPPPLHLPVVFFRTWVSASIYLSIYPPTARRAAMALVALSGDEQRILFTQLCNVLEPRTAVLEQYLQ